NDDLVAINGVDREVKEPVARWPLWVRQCRTDQTGSPADVINLEEVGGGADEAGAARPLELVHGAGARLVGSNALTKGFGSADGVGPDEVAVGEHIGIGSREAIGIAHAIVESRNSGELRGQVAGLRSAVIELGDLQVTVAAAGDGADVAVEGAEPAGVADAVHKRAVAPVDAGEDAL